jgi:hypothetical protein
MRDKKTHQRLFDKRETETEMETETVVETSIKVEGGANKKTKKKLRR